MKGFEGLKVLAIGYHPGKGGTVVVVAGGEVLYLVVTVWFCFCLVQLVFWLQENLNYTNTAYS